MSTTADVTCGRIGVRSPSQRREILLRNLLSSANDYNFVVVVDIRNGVLQSCARNSFRKF